MPVLCQRLYIVIRLAFSYGVGVAENIADPTVAEFNALARQVETASCQFLFDFPRMSTALYVQFT